MPKWELNFPIRLAEQILGSARHTYVLAKRSLGGVPITKADIDKLEQFHRKELEQLKDKGDEWSAARRQWNQDCLDRLHKWHYTKLTRTMDREAQFAHSEWCGYLMMGINMTGDDIVRHWDKLAAKNPVMKNSGKGKPLPQSTVNQIYECHAKGMTNSEIAKTLGISNEPVRKYLTRAGLTYNRKERKK